METEMTPGERLIAAAREAMTYYEPGYTPDEQAEAERMRLDVLDPPPGSGRVRLCDIHGFDPDEGRISLGTLDGPIDPGDA